MYFATFCTGNYFEIYNTYATIFNNLIIRYLSIKHTVHLPQCTWNMLLEYNVEKWTEIIEQVEHVANKISEGNNKDEINVNQSVQKENYALIDGENNCQNTNKGLWIDVIPQIKTHKLIPREISLNKSQ